LALEITTACLSIYHGSWAVYYLLLVLIAMGASAFSLMLIPIMVASIFFLPSIGILIAGIGILVRQPWAITVGGISAYCYLGILCFFLLLSIPAMLGSGLAGAPGMRGTEVSALSVLFGLFQLAGNLAGPLLLVGLYQGRD